MSRDLNTSLRRVKMDVGFLLVLCVASSLASPAPLEVMTSVATPLGSAQLVASASERDEGLKPAPPKEASASAPSLGSDDEQSGAAALPPPASEVGDMMMDPYHNATTMSSSDRDEEAVINNETDTVQDSHVNPINRTHEEEAASGSSTGAALDGTSLRDSTSSAPLDGTSVHNSTTGAPLDGTSVRDSTTGAPLDGTSVRDSSTGAPLDGTSVRDSTTGAPLDGTSVRGSSPVPTTESGTNKVEVPDIEEKIEHNEHKEESKNTAGKVDVTEKVGEMSLAEVTSLPVSALVSQHDAHDHPAISRTSSLNHTTQAAAILAGVLVLVAVLGYLGLILWRRVLEKRYGNREMLVNEDDDFKHFEL